jgi:hypothetical protein
MYVFGYVNMPVIYERSRNRIWINYYDGYVSNISELVYEVGLMRNG